MSRNLKIFAGAAVLFYIIGAVNESSGMYVLSAAALGVILAAYFLTRLMVRGVHADLRLRTTRTTVGRAVPGTVQVHNAGAISRTGMTLELTVENETVPGAGREYRFPLPPLPPRSRVDLDVPLECQARGRHVVRGLSVVAHDPVGVYRRGVSLDAGAGFLGLPRVCEAAGISSWELLSPEGRRSARLLRRSGGEFDGIRAHAPGDDLRHVHWKVSAHTGDLMVKQHRQRREAQVAVWLDMARQEREPSGPESATEVAVSVAATLVNVFVHGDYMISLGGQGLPGDLALPSRGEAYLDRVLVALAEAHTVPGPPFAEFCAARRRHGDRLQSVFAVTAAVDPGLEECLSHAVHRGLNCAVLVVGGTEASEGRDVLQSVEGTHDRVLERLQAAGLAAARVPTFESIPHALSSLAGAAVAVNGEGMGRGQGPTRQAAGH